MGHSLAQAVTRIASILSGLCWRSLLGGYFVLLAAIVWFIKSSYLPALWLDPLFGLYSLCVTVYLVSRFSLSLLYHPSRRGPDELPTLSLGDGMNIAHILTAIGFTPSNKEAKRKIAEGAVRLDDEVVSDPGTVVAAADRPLKLSFGRKRHGLLVR